MKNAPFFTSLSSSPLQPRCGVSGAGAGDAPFSEHPLAKETRGQGEATPALVFRGACFQPDLVPARSRGPRLRAQPVVAPALRTCACSLERAPAAFAAPGP